MPEVDYFAVVEGTHDIQNPSTPAKMRRVADYLAVAAGDAVLDIGAGRGWWAVELAVRYDALVTGLELNQHFAADADRRAAENGVAERVRTVRGPAAEFDPAHNAYDVVTCLGASFALGGYRTSVQWMAEAVKPGGRIAIGDVHAFDSADANDDLPALAELAHVAEEEGFEITGLVSADLADWDHYESQHWANVDAWAAAHPDHPKRTEFLGLSRNFRSRYLREERGRLGWSILVAAHRPSSG